MRVVNFSHFSYLAPLLAPVTTLAAWLIRPASTKRLVPPANAPLAHQRLTLPFARAGDLKAVPRNAAPPENRQRHEFTPPGGCPAGCGVGLVTCCKQRVRRGG